MKGRLCGLLAAVFLAAFGMGVAFAVIEIAVRSLNLVPDRFWTYDPLLGRRLIPGKKGWWTQEEGEFRVHVSITSDGRRDIERPRTKPSGVRRVLVLGDSFIEAMQVPLDQTFARRLEELLNAAARGVRYEVVTMAVSGYGTAAQWLWYEREGRLFDPDLVLLAFYPGNDVRNNSPTLEPALRPEYSGDEPVRIAAQERRREERAGWRAIAARSEAYRFLRRLVLTRHPRLAELLAEMGLVARDALPKPPLRDGIPVDYWVYGSSPGAEWEEAWRRTVNLLDRFRRSVQREGRRFAVMVVAGREQVDPSIWKEIAKTYPAIQGKEWDLMRPEKQLLDWCAGSGVPCLHLTPRFREAAGRQPLHYRHDGHWTAAGHALAAELAVGFVWEQMEESKGGAEGP